MIFCCFPSSHVLIFWNTISARASIDSEALAQALNEGYLSGAGIDVFENEPPLDTNHPLLYSKNTIITPHIAFASAESMEARAEIVFQNIKTWLEGKQQNII